MIHSIGQVYKAAELPNLIQSKFSFRKTEVSSKMFKAAIIVALGCVSCAIAADPPLNDLKVRYEAPGIEIFKDPAFVSVPRDELSALSKNKYENIDASCVNEYENGIKFYGKRYVPIHKDNTKDSVFVALYDVAGSVAGVQACWPMTMLTSANNDMKVHNISSYQIIKNKDGDEFACQTAYFINPEDICTVGRSADQVKAEGTVSQLSFQWGPTPATLKIPPVNRAGAKAEKWSMNSCFDRMGYHNFYDVEGYSDSNCRELHGYFLLYHPKTLNIIGFGFTFEGKSQSKMTETPPTLAVKVIQGCAPKCIVDRSDKYSAATMHVYFISEPKKLSCGIKENLGNIGYKVKENSHDCAPYLQ